MTLTRLRRRRSGLYSVEVPVAPAGPPTFFAAESACGEIWRYLGEAYDTQLEFDQCLDEDYFEVEHVPPQTWIGEEEEELSVAEGELVASIGPGSVLPIRTHRARISGGSYTAAAGVACTPAAYHGGFLYWVEVTQTGGLVFTLRRARPDLSEPSTVSSETVADPSGGDLRWINTPPAIAAGPAAVICEWLWTVDSPSDPPLGGIRFRFPLSAGSPEHAALPSAALTFSRAVPAPEGGFLAAVGTEVLHTGGSTALGLTWSTGYYTPGSTPHDVAAERLSLGPAGVLAVFGDLGGGRGFAVAPTGGPFESGPSADLYQLDNPPDLEPIGVGWIRREGP